MNRYLGDPYVEPAKFEYLRCQDIAKRIQEDQKRFTELQALMARAATGTGGAVVNFTVYQPELSQVQADLDLLHRTAGEKRCDPEKMTQSVPQLAPLH